MNWFRKILSVTIVLLLAFALAGTAHADGVLSLPRGLQSIEDEAFSGDTSLNVVVVPEGVGSIGDRAFANSSVSWINLPWSLNELGDDVFANTPLQGIIVRDGSPVVGLLEQKGLGNLIVYNNNIRVRPMDFNSRIVVPYNESAVLTVAYEAACEEGLRFFWYRIEKDENGFSHWVDLPEVNGPSLETDPINEKVQYFCRVADLFGNEDAVWLDVMVENHLRIWPENHQSGVYADENGNVTLRVEASADDESVMNFSWYRSVWNEEYDYNDLVEIEGEHGQSLTVTGITGATSFSCRVTDCYGGVEECWFDVDVDPGENTVSSAPARDITPTTAFVDLNYSVTAELLRQGYRMGVVYAESEEDLGYNEQTQRFENAMTWTWGGESGVYGPANNRGFAGWLDELIPGHTYYYFGVLVRENDDTVAAYEQNPVHSFTTEDGDELQTIDMENEGFAPRGNAKKVFRFVVPQDGYYALNADIEMDEMSVRRTDNSTPARVNNSSKLSFIGHEGETLYLFVRSYNEDAHITMSFLGEIADEDAVWPISVENIGATSADFVIGYTVTEETAQRGYHLGVAFSTDRDDVLALNNDGRFNCNMWWFEYRHEPALDASFSRTIDELIPGMTYYYRAFLIVDDTVVACGGENDIGSFTTGPADQLPEIFETQWGENNWTPLPRDEKAAFRFTPDRDGIYGLMADRQIGDIGAVLSGRNYASMEYNTDLYFFPGYAGETVVLFARSWDDNAGVMVRYFIDFPAEDSVSAVVADDGTAVGSTWANIAVTASVTEETANQGYHIGVAFGLDLQDLELDENEQRFHTDMWDWEYLDMPMNEGVFNRMLDQLIPEKTYLYRAFISVNNRVVAYDDTLRSFKTGSADNVAVIEMGGNYDLPREELVPYRFTAEQSGLYRLVLSDPVDQIDVRRSDGRYLTGGNRERTEAYFFLSEGETAYLYLRTWQRDDVSFEICFAGSAPESDEVSASRIAFEDSRAMITITRSITAETAEHGYGYGVEYSPYESFEDDHGNRYTADFFWRYSEDIAVDVSEDVEIDCLIPGVTYYYRPFIDYCDGSERVYGEAYSFTVDDGFVEIPMLELNEQWSVEGDGSWFLGFTAPESGVYVLENSANFTAINSEGMYLIGSDAEENNASHAVRALPLREGETVYFRIYSVDGSAWLTISSGPANLDTLVLDDWVDLRDSRALCFTAPEEGWYSFTVDQPWLGELRYYNSYVENWSAGMGLGFNVDTISLYAEEGETLYFISWYNMDNDLMRIRVEQASSPEENAVFSAEPKVGDTWASMEINYSVNEGTLMDFFGQGYFVGIAYSQYEDFRDENGNDATEMWTWDPMRVLADSCVIERTLDRLIPDTTYYYYAFLANAENNEIFAQEELKSFTTQPAGDNIPALTLGEERPIPVGTSVFSFRADTAGMYALVTHGAWDVEVRNTRGNWITAKYGEVFEIGPDCGTGFLGGDDELFYIYVLNGEEDATIAVMNGLDEGVLPELTVGEMSEELWGRQVTHFTAPADGWYRFECFSNWYGRLAIATPETGWVDPEYDEQRVTRYLSEGETVYPGCWFDDEHASVRLLVSNMEIPEEPSVQTLDVTDVTDITAVFHMSFGMPLLNDTQRYNYGVVIRPADDPDFAGGEAWGETYYDGSMIRHEMHDPYDVHEESFSDLPLCAGTTYYYEAILFIYDEQNDQWDTYFGGLKSFTTDELDREITAVNAGESFFVPWAENNDYQLLSFTVPENAADLYTVSVEDASIWVGGADRRVFWPMDFYGERTCFMPGTGHEGETYTIYLRVWNRDGINTSVEPQYAIAAEIGVNHDLSQDCLYRVTAPVTGCYLFSVSGERSMTVFDPNSGEIIDSWYWVYREQIQQGDTILFFCHPKEGWTEADGYSADVTILPQEFSVETEQELRSVVDTLASVAEIEPFLDFFDIHVNAPITLSEDLDSPTLAMLNLNDTFTVPDGVNFSIEGDVFINEGCDLLVQSGGTLALRGIYDGWYATLQLDGGTITMDGTFGYEGNSFIRLYPEHYADTDAMFAAADDLPVSLFVLSLPVANDQDFAAAQALAPTCQSLGIELVNGYSPSFAALAALEGSNTVIIANEGTNLVIPQGEAQSFTGCLRLNGATLTVNGELSVDNGGRILLLGGSVVNNGALTINENGSFLWVRETNVENNGTLTIAGGSFFAISTGSELESCEVVNNGTVYLYYDLQEGIRFVGDGEVLSVSVC